MCCGGQEYFLTIFLDISYHEGLRVNLEIDFGIVNHELSPNLGLQASTRTTILSALICDNWYPWHWASDAQYSWQHNKLKYIECTLHSHTCLSVQVEIIFKFWSTEVWLQNKSKLILNMDTSDTAYSITYLAHMHSAEQSPKIQN